MKYYLFLWLVFSSLMAFGQRNFDEALKMGDDAFQQGQYDVALQKYRAAQAFDLTKQTIIDDKIILIFEAIQAQKAAADLAKAQADKARSTARAAEKLARKRLKEVEKAKSESDTLKKRAEALAAVAIDASRRLDTINTRLSNIIESLYFYEDKFALAYRKDNSLAGRYGFIDKEGNIKIDYRYSEANNFNTDKGFARVKFEGDYYFVDTLGNEYRLAESISQLTENTEALDLSGQQLDKFPTEILTYPNLKVLLLYNNNISELPAELSRLYSLYKLDLSDNQIAFLPASSVQLRYLKTLDLSGNKLRQVPKEIANLTDLNTLLLARNQLDSIPITLGKLPNLNTLDLSFNKLSNIPTDFGEIESLNLLKLSGNLFSKSDISPKILFSDRFKVEYADLGRSFSNVPQDLGSKGLIFQEHLNDIGIGQLLNVHQVEETNDKAVIYLSLPFKGPDTIQVIWSLLRNAFAKENTISLEQHLFYKMVEILNVNQENASIQIYDTYDIREVPCFSEGIYFDVGEVKTNETRCKSAISEFKIGDNINIPKMGVSRSLSGFFASRKSLIDSLEKFAAENLLDFTCKGRIDNLEKLETQEVLRFTLKNICVENLKNTKPLLCELLSGEDYDCQSQVNKLILYFTISWHEESISTISIDIAGKYGVGDSPLGEYMWMNKSYHSFFQEIAKKFLKDFNIRQFKEVISGAPFANTNHNGGQVIYVKEGGKGIGLSWENAIGDLQVALSIAKRGDQIWVAKGIYKPTSDNNRNASFVIPDGIRLFGGFAGDEIAVNQRNLKENQSILSGEIGTSSAEDNSFTVVYTEGVSQNTIIDGFMISGGVSNGFGVSGDLSFSGAGWFNNNGSPRIKNCVFYQNYAREGAAIFNYANKGIRITPLIENCLFRQNKTDFDGGAIFNLAVEATCSPIVRSCFFEKNKATYGAAILNKVANGRAVTAVTLCVFKGNASILPGAIVYNLREGRGESNFIMSGCQFVEDSGTHLQQRYEEIMAN